MTAGNRTDGHTSLRSLSVDDLTAVNALEHELFPDDAWSPEMFADEVSLPQDMRRYLVAETEDDSGAVTLAGYAGVMFLPGGQADVLTIAVREDHWGRGIGSTLLGALIDAARDRSCTEMFLEVRADNDRAHGLYLRRGFTDLGIRRGYYQPSGMDAITMRKDLRR